MFFRLKPICALFFILFFTACRNTVDITSATPIKIPGNETYVPHLSVINIPVSFDVNQLENKLNQEFTGVLYKDESFDKDKVKYTITKAGNINIMADNNKLYVTLPLHIWVLGRWEWQACPVCPKISKSQDATFDVSLKTQTSISLTPDWKLQTATDANYTWDKKPTIEFGPLKIPLASILDYALAPQMSMLSAQFDKELEKRIALKKYVKQAWDDIQKPVLLDKETNTWLKIEPQGINTSAIALQNDALKMNIGIKAFISTLSGKEPSKMVVNSVPELIPNSTLGDTSTISLGGFISYQQAAALLKKYMMGEIYYFEDKHYQVKVTDLELAPSGEKLMLMLNLDGVVVKGKKEKNITGKVFLEGVPYYDAAEMAVKVKDLDYTVSTKNAMVKAASWIAKIGFNKTIQEKLTLSLKEQLETSKQLIQQNLDNNLDFSEYVSMKGKIMNLEPQGIYLMPDGIKAIVNAKGKVSLSVEKL